MKSGQQEALEHGIELFNEQRYFEAHEEWEEEWRLLPEGGERMFFGGLIMAAGAFVHYVRRECGGARSLLDRSMPLLKAGIEAHPDMGIGEFIADLEALRSLFSECSFRLASGSLPRIRRNGASA